jgi:hypothetical protein
MGRKTSTLSSHERRRFIVTNLAGLVVVNVHELSSASGIDTLEYVGDVFELTSIIVRVVAIGFKDRSATDTFSRSILDRGGVVDEKDAP